jgi:hypothetical protein
MFFFEKKNQKTFVTVVADLSGESAPAPIKAFCFFFSKKKAFLESDLTGLAGRQSASTLRRAGCDDERHGVARRNTRA